MGLFDRFLKWKKEEKVEETSHVQEHVESLEIEDDSVSNDETITRVESNFDIYEPKTQQVESTPEPLEYVEPCIVEEVDEDIEPVVEIVEEPNEPVIHIEKPIEKKEMEVSVSTYEQAMEKPRKTLLSGMSGLMKRFTAIDEEYFEELEDILIMADIGLPTVQYLISQLEDVARRQKNTTPEMLTPILIEEMERIYLNNISETTSEISMKDGLNVMLFIGVNGAGKTTTIAKMAHKLKLEGKKVLVAAGDTFRAGAVDQLAVWADRVDVDIVKSHTGGDAAAIIFDGIKKAKAENYDVLLCDTAGRLQNKVNLMNELDKIYRIIQREIPDAPHETLLVIDGTTGQNGLSQAKEFAKVARITGTVVTKLDGSAKGGIVLAIAHELHIPVKLVGLGEKPELLAQFEIDKYLYGLFSDLIKE
ncbi:MAG: signal recognition particle-docking protein FtsY [Culicoidibacterales bacterium]